MRHAEDLLVLAGLVVHLQHADRPARHEAAGKRRRGHEQQRVERIAVLAERLQQEAVVARVDDARVERAVEHDALEPGVVLVLVAAALRDLDEGDRQVGRSGFHAPESGRRPGAAQALRPARTRQPARGRGNREHRRCELLAISAPDPLASHPKGALRSATEPTGRAGRMGAWRRSDASGSLLECTRSRTSGAVNRAARRIGGQRGSGGNSPMATTSLPAGISRWTRLTGSLTPAEWRRAGMLAFVDRRAARRRLRAAARVRRAAAPQARHRHLRHRRRHHGLHARACATPSTPTTSARSTTRPAS